MTVDYSVIIPVYNEAGNVAALYERLQNVLLPLGKTYEIIFADDGSTDGSLEKLKNLKGIKIVTFKRNVGKSAALHALHKLAQGEIIIALDSDLENQPEDIPKLLDKLTSDFDMVVGWRQARWKGQWFRRKLPSLCANWLIRKVSKVSLHDYGCAFRVYRREVIDHISLQYDMQRMIPIQAALAGAKVTEISVSFVPRNWGTSKFGVARVYQVLVDLVGLYFRQNFSKRALHFFGGFGLFMILISFLCLVWAGILRLAYDIHFHNTPLPIFMAMFFLSGIQLILIGLVADLIVNSQSAEVKENNYYRVDRVIET